MSDILDYTLLKDEYRRKQIEEKKGKGAITEESKRNSTPNEKLQSKTKKQLYWEYLVNQGN